MNTIKKTLSLVLLTSSLTYSQLPDNWIWMNPKPQGNNLIALDFVNDNTGFAAGTCGAIMKTNDGGISWAMLNANTTKHFFSMFFLDANTGYIGGQDTILKKTTNGGLNWAAVSLPIVVPLDSLYDVMDIYFVNQNVGYAAGFLATTSKIWKTTNGGLNWITQTTGGANYLYDLFFINENTGFGAGGSLTSEIIKTTNGGNTWQFVEHNNYDAMRSIDFVNSATGFAAGRNGDVLKTTNTGDNWFQVGAPVFWDISSIKFINENTGYGFGSNFYLKTVNGGANWSILLTVSGSTREYGKVDITLNGTIHAVGSYGAMIRSTDGGVNFIRQPVITEAIISDIKFVNNLTGFAVGNQPGIILKTTSAGQTWVIQVGSGTFSLFGISFVNAETGFVCGSVNIKKTTNGGTNWTNVYASTTNEVFGDIFFVNVNTGFAVGSYGRLLKTTNAGANWTPSVIPVPGSFLNSVYFTNENTGYVVGDLNSAAKTTNGGSNWFLMSVPAGFSQNNNVFFADANTGFISATAGLFKTTDGGTTWLMLNAPAGGYRKVQFRGSFGYAVAEGGKIIKSTNGGISWFVQPTVTVNSLYALFINSDDYVFGGGDGGTMIKTKPTELTLIQGNSSEIAKNYSLSQNYPNPFNPVTTIGFSVSRQSFIELRVYNVLGEEVATLVNQQLAPGVYRTILNASGLPSGVYFYRLNAPDFSETNKMILIK